MLVVPGWPCPLPVGIQAVRLSFFPWESKGVTNPGQPCGASSACNTVVFVLTEGQTIRKKQERGRCILLNTVLTNAIRCDTQSILVSRQKTQACSLLSLGPFTALPIFFCSAVSISAMNPSWMAHVKLWILSGAHANYITNVINNYVGFAIFLAHFIVITVH